MKTSEISKTIAELQNNIEKQNSFISRIENIFVILNDIESFTPGNSKVLRTVLKDENSSPLYHSNSICDNPSLRKALNTFLNEVLKMHNEELVKQVEELGKYCSSITLQKLYNK